MLAKFSCLYIIKNFNAYYILLFSEKELVLEIDRLKYHKNGIKKCKGPNKMETFIKGLEEERDYWKGEVDVRIT